MSERTKLQAVRRQLGYSAAKTIAMLERQARADQITIMTSTSLKTKLSRWENGHESVGLPEYRRLFRERAKARGARGRIAVAPRARHRTAVGDSPRGRRHNFRS